MWLRAALVFGCVCVFMQVFMCICFCARRIVPTSDFICTVKIKNLEFTHAKLEVLCICEVLFQV